MFHDREDAARRLAERLQGRRFRHPLVLAIPRGGVVTGAVLARALGAELDVILARKLRAPDSPDLAVGALAEYGSYYLHRHAHEVFDLTDLYLAQEQRHQRDEIAWRKDLYRGARPPAPIQGRSVIVADDGIATGATMIAALQAVRAQGPHELIAAVPVAPPDRLPEVRRHCDEVVCLLTPTDFLGISQFYADFPPVEDAEAVELLRDAVPAPRH